MANLLDIVKKELINIDYIGTNDEELDAETEYFVDAVRAEGAKEGLEIDYCFGATQLCFIDEDNQDYVVKMGFTEKSGTSYYDDDGAYYEEGYDTYSEEYRHNYTELSYNIYKDAIDAGVAMFFAKVDPVGDGLWIQEYVAARENNVSPRNGKVSDEEINYVVDLKDKFHWVFDAQWIADCLFYYGLENFQKFMNFVKRKGINDLHQGNYGWTKDGYPRLLDYAGYYE